MRFASGLPAPLPDPPLADAGLVLRPWREADAEQIVAACRDPEIPRWTRVPRGYSRRDAAEFLAAQHARWLAGEALELAIADRDDAARMLGAVGVHAQPDQRADAGYWVAPEARGRRVAVRAVTLLAGYAFATLGVARLELHVDPRNGPSMRVAAAAGFVPEGILRSRLVIDGRRCDTVSWARLPTDPPPRRAADPSASAR